MTRGRLPALVAGLVAAGLAGGCAALLERPEDGCAALDVSIRRCRAIVEEARQRLGEHPPVTGIAVIPATQDAKTTLRAQNLLATVRFTFVDGSTDAVPVYCGPGRSDRLSCTDRPVGP